LIGTRSRTERLALNRDQIDEYEPPPNPAKVTDSRYASYVQVYGEDSWELDALDPRVLSDLVRRAIEECQEGTAWREATEDQEEARRRLRDLAENWTEED